MFNFITTNPKISFFHKESGISSFSLSRFLEFTPDSIKDTLFPIDDESLDLIKDLPVLFIAQPSFSADESCFKSLVRIGEIIKINLGNSASPISIDVEFKIIHDFGDISLKNITEIDNKFNIGYFQLYKSFWAIQDMDFSEALKMLVPNHQENYKFDAKKIAKAQTVLLKKIREKKSSKKIIATISDVNSYLKAVLDESYNHEEEVFYRGHSDEGYKLEPSLFRTDTQGVYLHRQYDAQMVNDLLTVQPGEFTGDRYMLDKLVRMQHFGLPTRLLDVTTNPLIALYFACSIVKDEDGNEIDGSVIIMSTDRKNIKTFDSDTVSCIANLSRLPPENKENLKNDMEGEHFNKSDSCQRLLHFIKDEKPYFQDKINPSDLKKIVFVKGRVSNPRIHAQSGAFLLFSEDAILPETGLSELTVKYIIITNKEKLKEQLARFGITESTIYPGIEKAAGEIAKKYANLSTRKDI